MWFGVEISIVIIDPFFFMYRCPLHTSVSPQKKGGCDIAEVEATLDGFSFKCLLFGKVRGQAGRDLFLL